MYFSSCDIIVGFSESRDSEAYRYDESRDQWSDNKTEEIGYTKENRTKDEKSETDLCGNSDPHIFSFPVEWWYRLQEGETDTARYQNEEGRVEKERNNMKKENKTRCIGTIHKRTLQYLSKTRIESTNNEEMKEKKSENRKESKAKFFLRTDEEDIYLIGNIENSHEYEVASKSTRTLDMSDATIPVRIVK